MKERICLICKKQFIPWNKDQKCCKKQCMDKNREIYLQKRHKIFTCKVCKKEFTNTGKGLVRKTYCSRKCAIRGKENRHAEYLEAKRNKTLEKKSGLLCLICDTDISKTNKRKYCSKECAAHGRRITDRSSEYKEKRARAYKVKQEFVDKKGGACEKCGYNNCLAALTFHHIDESTKEYTLDVSSISRFKKEILETELDKCQLLCFNCHMEVHNPDLVKIS